MFPSFAFSGVWPQIIILRFTAAAFFLCEQGFSIDMTVFKLVSTLIIIIISSDRNVIA